MKEAIAWVESLSNLQNPIWVTKITGLADNFPNFIPLLHEANEWSEKRQSALVSYKKEIIALTESTE